MRGKTLSKLALLTASATGAAYVAAFGLVGATPAPAERVVQVESVDRDLDAIVASGELRVAFPRDQVGFDRRTRGPEGFSFELATALADGLDLRLVPIESLTPSQALVKLARGEADLAAFADPGPVPVATKVYWSRTIRRVSPVVVGRGAGAIDGPEDLVGRRLLARRHSVLSEVARGWNASTDRKIDVEIQAGDLTTHQIALRAADDAELLAVLDEGRARLEARVFGPLETSAPLGPPLDVRWALRPNAPRLAEELDLALARADEAGLIAKLEARYFDNPDRLKSRRRPLLRAEGNDLSPFDEHFRSAGHRVDFDWRLLAAMSFAESGYDRWEVSTSGAMGLLQLMPGTAAAYGAEDPFDPRQNVHAGARYLRWLYDRYSAADDPHRLAFALAAYNIGHGHLDDARILALERGLDPHRWHGHVESVMPMLEVPEIAATLKHGGARGRMTRHYVWRVLELYGSFGGSAVAYAPESSPSSVDS